jgi:hypothetical protein
MEDHMRTSATVMACILVAGTVAIAFNAAAVSGEQLILAAEDAAPATTPPPEAAKPDPEPDSDQVDPQSAAPNDVDLSGTTVGKPGMGCCTMMSNGGIMCKC